MNECAYASDASSTISTALQFDEFKLDRKTYKSCYVNYIFLSFRVCTNGCDPQWTACDCVCISGDREEAARIKIENNDLKRRNGNGPSNKKKQQQQQHRKKWSNNQKPLAIASKQHSVRKYST